MRARVRELQECVLQEEEQGSLCPEHRVRLAFWCKSCEVAACGECLFDRHPPQDTHAVCRILEVVEQVGGGGGGCGVGGCASGWWCRWVVVVMALMGGDIGRWLRKWVVVQGGKVVGFPRYSLLYQTCGLGYLLVHVCLKY